jgi:Tlde1 domain
MRIGWRLRAGEWCKRCGGRLRSISFWRRKASVHVYAIETGEWFGPDGDLIGTGYSGALSQSGLAEGGQNNPAMCAVKDVGPIPPGFYVIGDPYTHPELGPLTMNLEPDVSNEMFGRDLFRVHGHAAAKPLDSSKGCVVLDHTARGWIAMSKDRRLQVMATVRELAA